MPHFYIRVGVSAAIVRDGRILLIEFDTPGHDDSGVHYNFPGGGVEPGESLREALAREAREEACADIRVGSLLHVFEYVPAHCGEKYGPTPALGLLFRCELTPGLQTLHARKPLLATPSYHLLGTLQNPTAEAVLCELIA